MIFTKKSKADCEHRLTLSRNFGASVQFNASNQESLTMSRDYTAMTLAEMLIVIGILGIVMVLIMSQLKGALSHSYINKARVEWSSVQGLFRSISGELGTYENWPDITQKSFYTKYVDPRLKYTRVKYFGEPSFYVTGGAVNACSHTYCTKAVEYELQNGAIYSFASQYDFGLANIMIDVNGLKPPNVRGVDIFHIHFNQDPKNVTYSTFPYGLIPRGLETTDAIKRSTCRRTSSSGAPGWGDYLPGHYQSASFYNSSNLGVTCLAILVENNFQEKDYPITYFGQ